MAINVGEKRSPNVSEKVSGINFEEREHGTLVVKVNATNVYEAKKAYVSFHVNYINVVVNMERKGNANVSGKSECH